jgi:hypothetical protein
MGEGHPINLVKPYSPPPMLSAYEFSILIDLDKVCEFLGFNAEELADVKKWRTIPYKISWQRWTGGYERLHVSIKDLETDVVYNREYNSYQADKPRAWATYSIAGGVWTEAVSDAEVQLDVLPGKSIRLFARRGRFGDKRKDFPFDHEAEPMPQALLFEVPLSEHLLDPFEKRREEIDAYWTPNYGRPSKHYSLEDSQRGI